MDKGNVLVIGNSGVGKSTLINAVLGEHKAETGWGTKGTTSELSIYENDDIPFRIIDSVGFEPSFFKKRRAISAVKKWSKKSVDDGDEQRQINAIWFCVEGTSSKLFPDSIQSLIEATGLWKSVPIIVVITKSYSLPERDRNVDMVRRAFAEQRQSANLRDVIPVVADAYVINDNSYVAPDGVTALIEATNELMPEGIKAAARDVAKYKLDRKWALAQGVVGAASAAGAVVGATPIPMADALILGPIEAAEVNALARIYDIGDDDDSKRLLGYIVDVGAASVVAKSAVSTLKAVPGINLGASAINAVVAGGIVAALGEGSIFIFEKIYLGEKSAADLDWVKQLLESKLASGFADKLQDASEMITSSSSPQAIAEALLSAIVEPRQAQGKEMELNSDTRA